MASAKDKGKETFGYAGVEQVQSPLSFQLNGHSTPEHPCDSIPEMDESPDLRDIPDPLGIAHGAVSKERK